MNVLGPVAEAKLSQPFLHPLLCKAFSQYGRDCEILLAQWSITTITKVILSKERLLVVVTCQPFNSGKSEVLLPLKTSKPLPPLDAEVFHHA